MKVAPAVVAAVVAAVVVSAREDKCSLPSTAVLEVVGTGVGAAVAVAVLAAGSSVSWVVSKGLV